MSYPERCDVPASARLVRIRRRTTAASLLRASIVLAAPTPPFAFAQTTTRMSVSSLGAQANGSSFRPVISRDGRFIAFESDASNLVANDTNGTFDVFVRD